VLCRIPRQRPIEEDAPAFIPGKQVLSIRDALFSVSEYVPAAQSLGRIVAVPTVGCPPAVPILVCGEEIDAHAIACFDYYGIDLCCVVK